MALPIEFHPATREMAELAANVKSRYILSLADALAAALANILDADLTGDPAFRAQAKDIRITWLTR